MSSLLFVRCESKNFTPSSTSQGLLSKDFSRLILIAFVLAIPLAWYSVNQWLEDYAYKTEIGVSVYLVAGDLTLLISLATMSYQSIKAARGNPVESLRSE